jgi:hypothetical protein
MVRSLSAPNNLGDTIAEVVAACSLREVGHTFIRNVCEPISAVAFMSGARGSKSGFNGG